MDKLILERLVALRHQLHMEPELSGHELLTVQKINQFIRSCNPDKTFQELGKSGIAYVYKGVRSGPTILFRADLDALPIPETITTKYASIREGVSHKCGHDGHSAILAGLAYLLGQEKPARGRVVLLFQPAEETGEGARLVLADKRWPEILPDKVFGFHNLPGYPNGAIILRDGDYSMASRGLDISLTGKTSHASDPDKGKNPVAGVIEILKGIELLPAQSDMLSCMVTSCHVQIGEQSFGVSPGHARLMVTLRSPGDKEMEKLSSLVVAFLKKVASSHKLKLDYKWNEEFPATRNDPECVSLVREAAGNMNLETVFVHKPFRWSEDFGNFTRHFPGAYFGIGAGEDRPGLHQPEYDFNDDIIKPSVTLLKNIIDIILK